MLRLSWTLQLLSCSGWQVHVVMRALGAICTCKSTKVLPADAGWEAGYGHTTRVWPLQKCWEPAEMAHCFQRGELLYALNLNVFVFSKAILKVLQGCLSHHIFLKPISNPETKNSYSYTISSAYCLIILNIGCSIPIFAMVTLDKIEKIKHMSMYVCLPLWEIVYSLKTAFCWVSPSCVARRPMRTAHIHVRIHKINQAQMI